MFGSISLVGFLERIQMSEVNRCQVMVITHILVHVEVGWFMVFNATFNNISVILWQSVLLVEETGVHSAMNGV